MKFYKYTEEELRAAIGSCRSFRQALQTLGVSPAGGNYQVIKNAVSQLSIDISHFKGQGWKKGLSIGPTRPIEDYLANKAKIGSYKLKLRLLNEGLLLPLCSKCELTEWMGLPAPLELDHINGDSSDNSLVNLRILCPNCHAQTSTYRGKNISKA